MKKNISVIALLLVVLMACTSCLESSTTMSIDTNGNGMLEQRMVLDMTMISELGTQMGGNESSLVEQMELDETAITPEMKAAGVTYNTNQFVDSVTGHTMVELNVGVPLDSMKIPDNVVSALGADAASVMPANSIFQKDISLQEYDWGSVLVCASGPLDASDFEMMGIDSSLMQANGLPNMGSEWGEFPDMGSEWAELGQLMKIDFTFALPGWNIIKSSVAPASGTTNQFVWNFDGSVQLPMMIVATSVKDQTKAAQQALRIDLFRAMYDAFGASETFAPQALVQVSDCAHLSPEDQLVVQWALSTGLSTGVNTSPEGQITFGPDLPVTKEQAYSTVFNRLSKPADNVKFLPMAVCQDTDLVSQYAIPGLNRARMLNAWILDGNGNLNPRSNVTAFELSSIVAIAQTIATV